MKSVNNKSKADHLLEVCYRLIREDKTTKALEILNEIQHFYQQQGHTEDVAWCNFRRAQAEAMMGRVQAAVSLYATAQRGFLESGKSTEAATCMMNQANCLNKERKHEDAMQLYLRAGKIMEKQHDAEGLAFCMMNIGLCEFEMGNTEQAILGLDCAERAFQEIRCLKEANSCKQKKIVIRALAGTSITQDKPHLSNQYGDTQRIVELIKKVQKLKARTGDFLEHGDIEGARQEFEKSSRILEAAGLENTPIWGDVRIGLLEVVASSGDVGRALADIQVLMELPALKQDYSFRGKAHIVAGRFLDEIGQPQKAVVHFARAVEFLQSRPGTQEKRLVGIAHHNWGIVLYKSKKLKEAIEQFQTARAIAEELQDSSMVAVLDVALANAYKDSGCDLSRTKEELMSAIRTLEAKGEKRHALAGKLNLAQAAASENDITEAKAILDSCLPELKRIGDVQLLMHGYSLAASVFEQVPGCEEDALQLWLDSIAQVRRCRDSLRSDRERILYLSDNDIADIYVGAILLCWKLGRVKKAFLLHEEYRNFALLARLAERTTNIEVGIPKDLKKRIDRLHHEFSNFMEQLGDTEIPSEQIRIEGLLHDLRRKIESAEAEARVLNPRYETIAPTPAIDLDSFQSQLDTQTLLLKYAVLPDSILLWAVSNDSCHTFTIEGAQSLSEMTQEYVGLLRRPLLFWRDQSPYTPYPEKVLRRRQLAHEIYVKLVELALSNLSEGKLNRLLICPDGFVSYIPFESLIVHPTLSWRERPDYLLDYMAVTYSPSATVNSSLATTHRDLMISTHNQKSWVAFGNPLYGAVNLSVYREEGFHRVEDTQVEIDDLPFTEEEVLRIAEVLELPTEEKNINLKQNANLIRLHNIGLDRYRIIHFACHAFLPDDVTWLNEPALLLSFVRSPRGSAASTLGFSDVMRLNLNADLVVLSACNTGFGPNLRGEGLISLARAFICAGCRSVVASFWTVSDASTPRLMEEFYRQMVIGLDIDESLRSAKQALMTQITPLDELTDQGLQAYYLDPFFWASFVLVGNREVPHCLVKAKGYR